jgi:hypothetical protein
MLFCRHPPGPSLQRRCRKPPSTAANQEQDGETGIADFEIDKAGPPAASGKLIPRSRAAHADPQI